MKTCVVHRDRDGYYINTTVNGSHVHNTYLGSIKEVYTYIYFQLPDDIQVV